MPIDTSVITGTKSHKHSAPSGDGGFLESSVTGMTNLTEGGIIQGNNSNEMTNLPLGTVGQSLQVNAGQTALEYYTPSDHVSTSIQQIEMAADFTTTSAVFVSITNLNFTALNNTFNSYSHFLISWSSSVTVITVWFQLLDNVTATPYVTMVPNHTDVQSSVSIPHALENNGQVIQAQTHGNGVSTITIKSTSAWRSFIEVFEIQ